MTLETFFEQFELLADAPNGVQKLRELILQLAVQGKLVPQDPNDEPASILFARIQSEIAELISQKKIRDIKALPTIREEDKFFEMPQNWHWCRLGEIIRLSSGDYLPSHQMAKDGAIPVYGGNGVTGYHNQANVDRQTLVIGRVGFYCGSIHLTPSSAWVTDNAFITYFSSKNLYIHFLYWLLKATDLQQNNSATAQPVISGGKVYPLVVGLPPLEEQKRIVAKVDRLMEMCDRLEEQQKKRRESCIRLNEGAIAQLLSASNAEESDRHWQRICNNFDFFYSLPENISKLRQAILQLAVKGKLVPQNSSDEAAIVLLGKIKSKKEQLLKNGKISRSQSKYSVNLAEVPYPLPDSWQWEKLGNLVQSMNNGLYKPSSFYCEQGTVCIRMFNIQDGQLDLSRTKRLMVDKDELETYRLELGDLVVNRVNSRELVGKAALVQEVREPLVYEAMNIRVRFICKEIASYINLLLRTDMVRARFQEDAKQASGQASISQPQVGNIFVPLPPLEEQKRIVAKVDCLMKLCDELETKLQGSYSHQEKLMEVAAVQLMQAIARTPALC